MNDSIANTFACAPSERSDDVRSGAVRTRWFITRWRGKS